MSLKYDKQFNFKISNISYHCKTDILLNFESHFTVGF